MPKTTREGRAKRSELPGTLRRSPAKAQRTFAKAHDSAAEQYGEGERAHRVAYAAVKHSFEKVGDHWEAKDEKGPSDPRSKSPRAREGVGKTYGGVDYEGHTKQELYDRARELGVSGRSTMSKGELAEAIRRTLRGERVVDPQLALAALSDGVSPLTERERQVLALMAEGRSNAGVAAELVVSGGAVEKHVASIFTKLGLPPGESDNRRVLAVLRYLGA